MPTTTCQQSMQSKRLSNYQTSKQTDQTQHHLASRSALSTSLQHQCNTSKQTMLFASIKQQQLMNDDVMLDHMRIRVDHPARPAVADAGGKNWSFARAPAMSAHTGRWNMLSEKNIGSRNIRRKRCEECGVNWLDWPSRLCPGCEAYLEHMH